MAASVRKHAEMRFFVLTQDQTMHFQEKCFGLNFSPHFVFSKNTGNAYTLTFSITDHQITLLNFLSFSLVF